MASRNILSPRDRTLQALICRAALAALLCLLLLLSASRPARAGSNTWTRLGLEGIRILAVAVAPADPSLVLATDGKAIYRSRDRGLSWTTATADVAQRPAIAVAALQFHPQNADVVYAGKGFAVDSGNSSTMYVGNSMQYVSQGYRSADGGTTWQPVTAGNIGSTSPVLVSTDRGSSWKQGGPKANPDLAYEVALNPTNPQELVAAGESNLLLQEIQRSTDGGKTWRKASLPGGSGNRTDSSLVYNADGSALFTPYTVYRSLDDGQTWQKVLAKPSTYYRVFPNPTNPDEVFVLGSMETLESLPTLEGIQRSADKGATFASFPAPPSVRSVGGIAFDTATPQTLYAATDDGVWAYTLDQAVAAVTPTPIPTATAVVSPTATAAPTSAAQASPTISPSPTEAPIAEVATAVVATATPSPTRTPTEESTFGSTMVAVGAGVVVLAVGVVLGRRIWRRSP